MLKINFWNGAATDKQAMDFAQAIKYEFLDMTISMQNSQVGSLDKKIENKSNRYSEDQITAFKSEREELLKKIEENSGLLDGVENIHKSVVDAMTIKNDEGFGNSEDNVRRILRCVAAADNAKLEKYAISGVGTPELYEALEVCHDITVSREDGSQSMTKAVKTAYNTARDQIESILKNSLSMPFETPYTQKVRVKFDAKTLRMLHESYVTGFTNKYDAIKNDKGEDTDDTTFKTAQVKTLVTKRTKKVDGKSVTEYNWERFNAALVRLVIPYISK